MCTLVHGFCNKTFCSFFITSPGDDTCGNRLTSCHACYYSATERQAPNKCRRLVRRKPAQNPTKALKILVKWGKCVEGAYNEVCTLCTLYYCMCNTVTRAQ